MHVLWIQLRQEWACHRERATTLKYVKGKFESFRPRGRDKRFVSLHLEVAVRALVHGVNGPHGPHLVRVQVQIAVALHLQQEQSIHHILLRRWIGIFQQHAVERFPASQQHAYQHPHPHHSSRHSLGHPSSHNLHVNHKSSNPNSNEKHSLSTHFQPSFHHFKLKFK